jgi:hypothetical protein
MKSEELIVWLKVVAQLVQVGAVTAAAVGAAVKAVTGATDADSRVADNIALAALHIEIAKRYQEAADAANTPG